MRSKKFLWGLMLAIAITVMMLPATVFADDGDGGDELGWYLDYESNQIIEKEGAKLTVQVIDRQTGAQYGNPVSYQWISMDEDGYPKEISGATESSYTATAVGQYACYVTEGEDTIEAWFNVYAWSAGEGDTLFLKGSSLELKLTGFEPGVYDPIKDFSYQWEYAPSAWEESVELSGETKSSCIATKPGEYRCLVTRQEAETESVYFSVYLPIEKVDITLKAPLCMQESITPRDSWGGYITSKQTNRPVVSTGTKGVIIDDSGIEMCWISPYIKEDVEDVWDYRSDKIQFKAGSEYVAYIPLSTEKGYAFVDEEDLRVSFNGFTPITRSTYFGRDEGYVYAKVKAEHYKDAGTVTKAATTTAEGVKTFKCKGCGKVLGTESIPKLPKKNTTVKKPTLTNVVANSSKKTNNPKWSKVSGATGYEIAWRLRGAKKWSTKNVGNTTQAVVAKQKMKGLYEYKVRAKKAETATTKAAVSSYSNVLYRYYYTMQKLKFKPEKKAIEVSWAKDSNATGYQILYSTSNKYKDGYGAKVITIGKNSITKRKVTGLQSGKTYYVQTRAIKKVGKTNYIGNLSSPIAVKVK